MDGAGEDVLYVALHEHNEAVSIHRRDLPPDPNPVLDLLASEAAPLQSWFDAAKAYLANGNVKAFTDIIADATSAELLKDMLQFFKKEPTFERMSMFCAMAAYYIEAARAVRDANEKTGLLVEAERYIKEAEEIDRANGEVLPAMARAFLLLARGEQLAASKLLKSAERRRHNGHVNHAPVLVQAAIEYGAGRITAAIDLYAKVLRVNPHCPPEVRLGIAACYYRSGKLEAATAAYNRVLELDAGNADALLGLAVIKFGSSDAQEGLNSGLQLLQRAYDADPSHPGVLCALSHFSLLKGEAEQALRLAQVANEGADTDRLRAVLLSLLGRCYHATGDLAAAQYHYAQAIRLDPKAPLPHLGTAQAYLATGSDPTNAVSELEIVLRALPGNSDALWLLGGLLPVLPERVAKTLQGHREAAARHVNDAGLQEMLGELLAAVEPSAALVAFNQALSLHRQKQQAVAERNADKQRRRQQVAQDTAAYDDIMQDIGEAEEVPAVPAKLLNNTAVLKYRSGDVSEAAALMDEATRVMMSDPDIHPMQKVTMGYNMARLREATGELTAAREAYQELLQQFPGYIDCYLRLSSMAKAAGDIEDARQWASRATEQAGGHVDAQAMLACLHVDRKDLAAARECVNAVGEQGRHDPYMLLTHANVILAAIPTEKMSKPEVQKSRKDYIVRALKMYQEVLKSQPDNIYAVNGLGICLAELGHFNAAKQAFDEVVRATSKTKGFVKLPETYVNLGNIWLSRQQYNDALKMYEHASKLYNHKNAQILLYIARAHHDAGDQVAAKRALLKALHIAPGDTFLRFNLGFVLQELALKTFKKKYLPGDPSKLQEYEVADTALSEAAKIFQYLLALGKQRTRLETKKLQLHADYCQKHLPAAAAQLQTAQSEAQLQEQQARVTQMQLAAADAERKAVAKQKAIAQDAEAARKRLEANRVLEESRAKVEQLRQQRAMAAIADNPEDGGRAGGSKKKRKKGGNEDMGDFYVDDAQPIERLPKAKKTDEDVQDTLKRTGLDSSDDEGDYNPDEDDLFGSGGGSDDERQQQQDDDEQPAAAAAPGRGRLKLKKRAAATAADEGEEVGLEAAAADDDNDGLGFEDEAAGDTTAADFVDELFVDDPDAGVGDAAGGAQQRKRARQALESDDEDDGAMAAAAAVNGDAGDAAPMDEDDDLDALF